MAQNIVFLVLNLDADHASPDVQIYLENEQDGLLHCLCNNLHIREDSQRPDHDELQITTLFRLLLELSGDNVDLQWRHLSPEYTTHQNRDLYAKGLGIEVSKVLGPLDRMQMCRILAKSPTFVRTALSVESVESWSLEMEVSLQIGFPEGHLV